MLFSYFYNKKLLPLRGILQIFSAAFSRRALAAAFFCLFSAVCFSPAAFAALIAPGQDLFPPTAFPSEKAISEDKPVVLTADNIEYLQKENIIVASGNVEAVQGETILLCDRLVYDRARDIVLARGNVAVVDQTNNVMFAEEAELRDSFRAGVIEQFKARLSDDSVFAADQAVRINEYVMELKRAVYSPCKVKCAADLPEGAALKSPLWQVRASKVRIDEQQQEVTYDNAWMELYGLPVFYTPHLSHATPNANSRAGIMTPEFLRDRNLGNIYKLPFYYPISPDRDIVITPIYTSQEGLVMRSIYRQKYDSGQMNIAGSITNPRDRDAGGNLVSGRQWRGHIYARADFEPDSDTRWGFDVKRTSDDTYMRKYKIDSETLLTSKIYGENYGVFNNSPRSVISAEAVTFQGLTAIDDSKRMPLVLPLINADYESDPGIYGSRYFVNGNAQILARELGAQSRRLSNTVGWRLPYTTDNGQRIELRSQLRGDVYDVGDVNLSNGNNFSGTTGRLVPEASIGWSYPLITSFGDNSADNNSENSVTIAKQINAANSDDFASLDNFGNHNFHNSNFANNRVGSNSPDSISLSDNSLGNIGSISNISNINNINKLSGFNDLNNNNEVEEGGGSLTLEPVVRFVLSPNGGNPEKIPNEDSLVPEFSDGNLFVNNRFSGYDRIEHGPRASYGMRAMASYRRLYFDGLLGQHYRMQEDRNFPFSNDLNDHFSDYVGKAGVQWKGLYLAYRFRLDKENLNARRREVDMSYSGQRLQMSAAYLSLKNDPILASREEFSAVTNVAVNKNWLLGVNFRKDLEIDQITNVGGQLLYKNECVGISYIVSREFTRDREIKPSTKYLITVSLKNLN